ncbi:MAG TPA: hypothetical protein VMQ93_04360 [Novosphingobium sp.]|nr:hypothetical protein [Novosphingobium sp.]
MMPVPGGVTSPVQEADEIVQPDDADVEFLRCHYQQLFDRNEKAHQIRWQFIQLSLAGVAAFYAGLLSDGLNLGSLVRALLGIVPLGVAVLGLNHARALRASMISRGQVMRSIERKLKVAGWQVHRAAVRDRRIDAYLAAHPRKIRAEALAEVRKDSDELYQIGRRYWVLLICLSVIFEACFLASLLGLDRLRP